MAEKPKRSPLSAKLQKDYFPPDPPAEQEAAQKRPMTQKEFTAMIYQTVDEKIAAHTGDTRPKPIMAPLIILALIFPLVFSVGNDLYGTAKPLLMERLGVTTEQPVPIADPDTMQPTVERELLQTLIDQNKQVMAEMDKLRISQDQKMLGKLDKLIETQQQIMNKVSQKTSATAAAQEPFDFDAEKKKLYDLARLDMDDPIATNGAIEAITSAKTLRAMIGTFDRILLNAASYGISDFHIKNASEGKRRALKQLQSLR